MSDQTTDPLVITPKEETPEVTKDIHALENLERVLSLPNTAVDNSKIGEMPVAAVDEALGDFVRDAFEVTKGDFAFNKALQEHIMDTLATYTPNQIVALYSNHNVNLNDKVAKLINPFAQISVAKTQAEIAARKELAAAGAGGPGTVPLDSQGMRMLNAGASKEVIQGLSALDALLKRIGEVATQEPKNTD